MESNQTPNNQMALRGVVLVLALIAAAAFVLARGLDDDGPAPVAAEATAEPTAEAEPTSDSAETPSGGDTATATPAPATDETQPPASDPAADETQPPASDPGEPPECRDPSTIGVLVANGTDVTGAAGRLAAELNAANYVTLPPVNAGAQTSSAFYFRAGYEVDAQCVASQLGVGAGPFFPMSDPPPGGVTLETLGNAYVLILIGPDSLAQRPG
ncbi:LytR C-terminal domain-containing protein [Candidatus Poriferisocius sp.]|uniref:LytR C-terminal domain-containing protein n=1 Tax=Candidatus Poriferisocius sp. TaxID=3101276 RepID=UPI003B0236DD